MCLFFFFGSLQKVRCALLTPRQLSLLYIKKSSIFALWRSYSESVTMRHTPVKRRLFVVYCAQITLNARR